MMKVVTSSASTSASWSAIHGPLLRLAVAHPPTAGVSSAGHVPHVVATTAPIVRSDIAFVHFEFFQPGPTVGGGQIFQTFQIHPHADFKPQPIGTIQIEQPKQQQQQQQQGRDVSRLRYRPVGRLKQITLPPPP